jgi:hypothetical protein
MYARVSRAHVKPDKHAEMRDMISSLQAATHELPDVRFWLSLLSDSGELTVIGAYPDKAAMDRTAHVNEARWADAQHLLQDAPTIIEGEIIGFMTAG